MKIIVAIALLFACCVLNGCRHEVAEAREEVVQVPDRFGWYCQHLSFSAGWIYVIKDRKTGREYLMTPKGGVVELRPSFNGTNFNALLNTQ